MYFWIIMLLFCFSFNGSNSMTISVKNLLEEGLIGSKTSYLSLDWSLSHHYKLVDWTRGVNLTSIAAESTLSSVSALPVRVSRNTVGSSNFFSQMKYEGDSLGTYPVVGHKFLLDPSSFGFEGRILEFYYLTSLVEGNSIGYLSENPEALVDIPPEIRKEANMGFFKKRIKGFHFPFPMPLSFSPFGFLHPASLPRSFIQLWK